jgi:hypothetical protein
MYVADWRGISWSIPRKGTGQWRMRSRKGTRHDDGPKSFGVAPSTRHREVTPAEGVSTARLVRPYRRTGSAELEAHPMIATVVERSTAYVQCGSGLYPGWHEINCDRRSDTAS